MKSIFLHICLCSEYRGDVATKYRKKIELMVRKPDREADEVEEAQMDCPFCNMPGPETDLQCVGCQNVIPFDIATGVCMFCLPFPVVIFFCSGFLV